LNIAKARRIEVCRAFAVSVASHGAGMVAMPWRGFNFVTGCVCRFDQTI
jgi:hypothetical protein